MPACTCQPFHHTCFETPALAADTPNYGSLYLYRTATFIRAATHEDWSRSVNHADKHTGVFIDRETSQSVYIEGAPPQVEDQIDEETGCFRR